MTRPTLTASLALALLAATATASFAQPQQFAADATRYMALGDSIPAGYRTDPATNAYPYLLYQDGVLDRIPHTLFCNASVPGATSADVLAYQVPQAIIPYAAGGFNPAYITLTVGGNDLLSILQVAATDPDPAHVVAYAQQVLGAFGRNLAAILYQLRTGLPDTRIFVANQYTIPEIQAVLPLTNQIISAFNTVVARVVGQFAGAYTVDVYNAFLGRTGLLLVERHGASPFEVHPTNAGQRVMEQAFEAAIGQTR